MKISWAYRIIGLFTGFVLLIVFMVVSAFKQDVNLVSEDYYEREIRYQEQIEKLENSRGLQDKITFTQKNNELVLSFAYPALIHEGEVLFLRPSDPRMDVTEKLVLNQTYSQLFERNKFKSGYYKMQIDWQTEGKKYYIEKDIFIQ